MHTAISGGLRPTTLLLRKQPRSKWKPLDFVLFQAHAIWRAEQSQQTGHPLWLTRSLDPRIGWAIEEREDAAEAALEAWDEKNQGKKRKKGVTRFAVPTTPPGLEGLLYGGISREQHYATMAGEGSGVPLEDDPAADLPEDARPSMNPADYGMEDPAKATFRS